MNDITEQPIPRSEEATIKMWRKRVKDARNHFDTDFKRMREDMEFAAGIQWQGQDNLKDKDDRYIANFITNHVNSKVAALYAKDPKAEAKCRARLNYEYWDGEVASKQEAIMVLQQSAMTGVVTPAVAQAQILLEDIQQGQLFEHRIKRVGQTLEVLYQYECDRQEPSFKKQMKQFVRRVVTTGVGYLRINYIEPQKLQLTSELTNDTLAYRLARVREIITGIQNDQIHDDDPRIEQLKLLLNSVESSVQEQEETPERIEFDFPSATSIIVDPRCKAIKGFLGADWIAQQFLLPLDVANTYFNLTGDNQIKPGGNFVEYSEDAKEKPQPATEQNQDNDKSKSPLGCFWEVFDYTTKTSFFICDGWDRYVTQPAPVEPCIYGFWPIFALTFNDVEVEAGQKVSIYPPSDVRLLMPMQKERNRSRQELREHRKVNRPFFWTQNGWLSEKDLDKFQQHETGELISLQGVPPDGDVRKALGIWMGAPIDQNVYSSAPLDEDMRIAVGSNQLQQQEQIRHVAATPAVIQEQSRVTGVSSNVDDLDMFLSDVAKASGEIMLKAFSPDTVKAVVGRGAAWPDQDRADFVNNIFLEIVAASSGRPNKAIDVQNAQQLSPLLLQAGANPWAIIKYLVRVTDANLEPLDFAPVMPAMQSAAPQTNSQHMQPGSVGSHPQDQQMPAGVQRGGAN